MPLLTSRLESPATRAVGSTGHPVELRLRSVPVAPLPFCSVDDLGKRLGVDPATLLDLMAIPERTRARRRHEGALKPDEADRLQRIARVFGEAVRVFGSDEKAARWLKTPAPYFDNQPPLAWLGTDAGAHAVSQEIIRIDFGDFA